MGAFGLSILTILIFISVYTIVDRICRCAETKAMCKAYAKYAESTNKHEENKEE